MSEAPTYTNWIGYVSFDTTHDGVNGLDFDNKGNLFVSEFMSESSGYDSGLIRKITAHSLEVSDPIFFQYYRPTGIAATGWGTLYFPARKWSMPVWGELYLIESFDDFDPSYDPVLINDDIILTAIAIDNSGNLYGGDHYAIRTRNPYTGIIVTIAEIGVGEYVEELAFDSEGNLYALMQDHLTIIKYTPPFIEIDGCVTGVIDWPFSDGSTISDKIAICEDLASFHGEFVSCVVDEVIDLRNDGSISNKEMSAIVSCVAQSNVP